MKSNQPYYFPSLFIIFALAISMSTTTSQGQDEASSNSTLVEKNDIDRSEKPADASRFSGLSEEEQKKLREALRRVWSDPTVLSARENVNRSAREYHQAVRATLANQDPETVKILDKLQKSKSKSGTLHDAMGHQTLNGSKKRPGGGILGHRLDQILTSPAMFERMSEKQKALFKETAMAARQHSDVIAAREELRQLGKEDEEMRKRKLEVIRKFRKTYFEAIVELAPELREVMPPPGNAAASGQSPFGGKSKGKGPRKRPID